jgi:hypothetical protein
MSGFTSPVTTAGIPLEQRGCGRLEVSYTTALFDRIRCVNSQCPRDADTSGGVAQRKDNFR